MPKLAANLTLLFGEVAFLKRFAAARRAGFAAVECQFPYAHPEREVRAALTHAGLDMVLFNLPAGQWSRGERGIACHPNRVGEFEDGVAQALAYARTLDCPRLNVLAGVCPGGFDTFEARETLVRNLDFAADALAADGRQVMVEPLNTFDVPGFFLNRFADALAVVDAVGRSNVRIQFDVYHAHRMGEDICDILERHLDRIGHIQLADAPHRHEPGTGEIDVPALFERLDRLGYDGWVGCEYTPATETAQGLAWARPYLDRGADRESHPARPGA